MTVYAYAAKGAKQTLEPFQYELGPIGPGEVDVKVTHCGICHSDLAMIDNDWQFSSYPLVAGHEAVGTISAVGSSVSTLKAGQRVGVGWQCGACYNCEWCQQGLESLCASERDTIVAHHGAFADYVRVDAKFALSMPDALDSATAGPLMCAGTTVFTPMARYGVKPTMKTAVVGIGGLGHLAVQYLAAFGCEVTAISSSHNKDEEARSFGATKFIATKTPGELQKAAGAFDFILCTVTADLNWGDYLAALRPQGELVFVGVPESALKLPPFDIIGKEKSVRGGRAGSPKDTAAALEFAARHKIKPMCESFAMKDINAAIAHVHSGKARYRAVLVA
jgi:uncharacterized zinc-type alcohol dehydrogenase-like protein